MDPQEFDRPTLAETLFSRLRSLDHRLSLFHAALVSLFFAACSMAYHQGGLEHPEIGLYLPYYLSDKPLLNKLYDSKRVELNTYCAREVSYVFDYLDCKFIELSVGMGHPHFLSITTYLFLFIIGLLLWHFASRILKLPSLMGLALLVVFWTSPSIFLAGSYFRSAKNGLALMCALLFLLLYRLLKQETEAANGRSLKRSWFALFFISWIGTLFDRQGVFIVGMSVCFVLYWNYFVRSHKHNGVILSAFVATLFVGNVYNAWVGPGLTEWLNHYEPNFGLQQIPWHRLFNSPFFYAWEGIRLYVDTVRFMLGNISFAMALTGLTVLVFETTRRYLKQKIAKAPVPTALAVALGLVATVIFLFIGLDIIMLIAHRAVELPDVRRTYYWVPHVVILLFAMVLGLARLRTMPRFFAGVLLCFAIIGNVYAIPKHRAFLREGHLKFYYQRSPRLLEALKNINNPEYKPAPDILSHPLYECFAQSFRRQLKADQQTGPGKGK